MFNNAVVYANSITVEAGAGWHDYIAGDAVLGALRLEGSPALTGSIVLNTTTSIVNGDGAGTNSVICAYVASSPTLSGVISGPGDLAMSRFTAWNGGSPQTVNILVSGSQSNTYAGKTVVNGQGEAASLVLGKSNGAVAIPANTVVQMGSNTNGQANLRMALDNQFGPGVVMNFVNASGQWMRFDLKGTAQTLAGLNAGTTTTQAGAVIQNQGADNVVPAGYGTLTLNGSGTYLYNGYLRDADNGSTAQKLNVNMSGSGLQTLVGGSILYTGTTNLSGGTLALQDTTTFASPTVVGAARLLARSARPRGFQADRPSWATASAARERSTSAIPARALPAGGRSSMAAPTR